MSTVVIGCGTPGEVEQNARITREFEPLSTIEMQELEAGTKKNAGKFTSYKVS